MVGCARTRLPPFRKRIPYIEQQAAKVYEQGLRRCVNNSPEYGEKYNPLDLIKDESQFLARYRFPKQTVRDIASGFGASPFWEKKTDPNEKCCKKFVNAEWVVSIFDFFLLLANYIINNSYECISH